MASLLHVCLFATPWTAACQAPQSSTMSWSLFKFKTIELVMLYTHLVLCHALLLLPSIFPSIKVFSWPNCWNFGFSISPANKHSGLISFRIDWFDLLVVHGTLKESSPALQFKSINSLALSLCYGPSVTSVHDYWENHIFDYMHICLQSDIFIFLIVV